MGVGSTGLTKGRRSLLGRNLKKFKNLNNSWYTGSGTQSGHSSSPLSSQEHRTGVLECSETTNVPDRGEVLYTKP